jgi:hypothetical protein
MWNRNFSPPQIVRKHPSPPLVSDLNKDHLPPIQNTLSYPSLYTFPPPPTSFNWSLFDRFLSENPHVCLHFTVLRLTVGCSRIFGSNPEQTTTPTINVGKITLFITLDAHTDLFQYTGKRYGCYITILKTTVYTEDNN